MTLGAQTTFISARLLCPDMIERGADQTLKCPLYQSGSLLAPTSGTFSLYDASNAAVVDAQAVTVAGDVAEYDVSAATTAALTLGLGWRVEWALVVAAATLTYRNTAALVRYSLAPTLTDADLYRRFTSLDPSSSTAITSLSTYQGYRDESWAEIQLLLLNRDGRRPNLIMDPSALRSVHMYLSLAFIFDDLSTRLNPAYRDLAGHFRHEFREAWDQLTFEYDAGDDGISDSATDRRAAEPTVWLSGRW